MRKEEKNKGMREARWSLKKEKLREDKGGQGLCLRGTLSQMTFKDHEQLLLSSVHPSPLQRVD